ncbi:hypothetical protein D3C76_345510 [compost metagenome]
MPGFKTGFNQLGPDVRQLMQLRAKQVDTLATGDFGVEVVFLRHHTNRDQFVGGDLTTGDAWHHRICAVFLHVGHEGVVGVLQRHQRRVHDRLVPARRQDRAHRRLAHVATGVATAMLGQQFFESDHPFYPHQRIKLLAGIGEVFAQALVDADTTGNQLMLENLLEQPGTTTATGAGLGLRLEQAEVGAATVDGRANGTLGDVVARAHHGRFGQRARAEGRRAFGRRQNQAGGFRRQRNRVLHVLQQRVVIAVVTDQHRTEYMLARRVHHQASIAGRGFVDELITARARRAAVGVADGTDIDAQQLELGRHIRAHERLGGFVAQQCGNTARHLVARGDQAKNAAVPRGTLADRIDIRIAALALIVNHHAAARADFQRALTGQRVLRTDTGGEHDQVGFKEFVISEVHPVAVFLACADRLRSTRQVHTDAEALDLCLERQATVFVQLHRHQARGEFHHMSFQPQGFQGVGGFQTEQATADHHTASGVARCGTNGIEVFKGAIHQARIALGAFDRRHKRIGPGGQHQFVVGDTALRGDQLAACAVDFQDRHPQMQGDARGLVQRRFAEGQRLGITAGEVLGQVHTVVGTHRLFAEDVQSIVIKGTAFDQLFDTMMSDHAIADHDQRLQLVQSGNIGIHKRHPSIAVQKAKKNA